MAKFVCICIKNLSGLKNKTKEETCIHFMNIVAIPMFVYASEIRSTVQIGGQAIHVQKWTQGCSFLNAGEMTASEEIEEKTLLDRTGNNRGRWCVLCLVADYHWQLWSISLRGKEILADREGDAFRNTTTL